jgi:hydrogenase/urease accessory protein HupE
MSTLRIFSAAVALLLSLLPTQAHPVAQGSMEVFIRPQKIEVTARVSNEQVFVADAHAAGDRVDTEGGLEAMWQRHAEYLLTHLRVEADGASLAGRTVAVTPPQDTTVSGFTIYELEFPVASGSLPPGRVSLNQTLLREFEFAPGNPWEATFVVNIAQEGRARQSGLLFTAREPLVFACADWAGTAAAAPPEELHQARLFREYLWHGVMHILTGYDHLLFMAALVLATVTLWDLVKVVTAFTLAHTLTLALSVLDVVRLPSHIVEPMIAASIVVVAVQNIAWPERSRGFGRLLIAFGFGLFHGLGFAGGLMEAMADLPGIAVWLAIAAFSIGVELGHQAVVLPLFAGLKVTQSVGSARVSPERISRWALRFGSVAICAAGVFYFVAAVRG